MNKVSSNAGKHPYLRPENDHLFDHIRIKEGGIPMNSTVKPVFVNAVQTEYTDKNGKKLFYRDVVMYKGEEYRIDYDSKEFCWVLENLSDPKNRLKLMIIADFVEVKKKSNK